LTISTYCVAPTSPFVSGGRHEQVFPCEHGGPNGRHAPSKFAIGAEIGPEPFFFWITGSLALLAACCGSGSRWRVSGPPSAARPAARAGC